MVKETAQIMIRQLLMKPSVPSLLCWPVFRICDWDSKWVNNLLSDNDDGKNVYLHIYVYPFHHHTARKYLTII